MDRPKAFSAEVRELTLKDPDYPDLLRKIHDPPAILYVKGTLLPEDAAAVAIVGTRSASPYGLETARRLAMDLARCGITVVSGLAEGIDAAGHEGALEAGGRTIAVVGHGLAHLYPPQHRKLAQRIAESGCLLSEFPMEAEPKAWHFPQRNRVIAGVSLGVIVVEAPLKSGALITARHALEQGREVFAVPGPVSSERSRGTHALIRDGARLVESSEDVLEELAPQLRHHLNRYDVPKGLPVRRTGSDRLVPGTEEERRVFEAVPVGSAANLEEIARTTTLPPTQLLAVLTGLELKGAIRQVAGRGFSRAR